MDRRSDLAKADNWLSTQHDNRYIPDGVPDPENGRVSSQLELNIEDAGSSIV
ncbi:hypothetical protein [Aminobacter sp. MET-1]|uniref:hypothetical protein n=1 Tax=Aminobacter sp. MET-1 TaxID=2951085 RepID=UPI002269D8D9|nr:hypothetical protein [Aminobacter sp. MET-1]MCX8570739.1 hypothetical protein [Aminobacter sp. MET-1]